MFVMGSDVIMAGRVMLFLLFMNWCGYGLAAIHQASKSLSFIVEAILKKMFVCSNATDS
jgi:hypothetical protein